MAHRCSLIRIRVARDQLDHSRTLWQTLDRIPTTSLTTVVCYRQSRKSRLPTKKSMERMHMQQRLSILLVKEVLELNSNKELCFFRLDTNNKILKMAILRLKPSWEHLLITPGTELNRRIMQACIPVMKTSIFRTFL